jgi:hypothetical protein
MQNLYSDLTHAIPQSIKYIAYGFGIASGVILFLFGIIVKGLVAKVKKFDNDSKQLNELATDVEVIKSQDEGRNSFTRGLYAISERLAKIEVEQLSHKDRLKRIEDRCEQKIYK